MIYFLLATAGIVIIILALAKPKASHKFNHKELLAVYGTAYKHIPLWAEPLIQLHPFKTSTDGHGNMPKFVDWTNIPVVMWPSMYERITQCERLLELLPALIQTFPGITTYIEHANGPNINIEMQVPLLLGILRGCCARLQGKVNTVQIQNEMRMQIQASTLVYYNSNPANIDEYCQQVYSYAELPCNQGHLQLVLDIVNTDQLLLQSCV